MSRPVHLIDTQQLQNCLDGGNLRIVDCRFDLADPKAGRQSYLRAHIPGAVYADLDLDLAAAIGPDTGRHPLPDARDFAATLGRLGIDNRAEVIVYDADSGAVAARAWWMLRWMGHEKVRLLNGGMQQWSREGRPAESGTVRVAGTRFEGQPRREMTVTTAELVREMEHSGTCVLVDARDARRFRGEVEPIDAVAGHVPGARNLPYSRSLTESGTWKERSELEALWSAALGEDRRAGWIAMCGSGVTACHLAISALEAGYREPRLYVGSWSEWIRDPDRPVAPGRGPT